MSSLEELLWNKVHLTFLIFKKILLALNHFFSSTFTLKKKYLYLGVSIFERFLAVSKNDL